MDCSTQEYKQSSQVQHSTMASTLLSCSPLAGQPAAPHRIVRLCTELRHLADLPCLYRPNAACGNRRHAICSCSQARKAGALQLKPGAVVLWQPLTHIGHMHRR